jgi:hypothetical protein
VINVLFTTYHWIIHHALALPLTHWHGHVLTYKERHAAVWRRRCLTHSPTPIVPPPFTLARRSRRRAAGTSRCQRGQRRRLAYNLLALGRNALSPLPLSLAASATNRMAAPRAAHARRTRHYQYHRLGLLATFRRCSHHSPPQHSGWRCAPSLLAASERAARSRPPAHGSSWGSRSAQPPRATAHLVSPPCGNKRAVQSDHPPKRESADVIAARLTWRGTDWAILPTINSCRIEK